MTSEEVRIDHRVHSRLIGARGRAISKIMDEYKVDIRMPGRDAEDPDVVVITGRPDDIEDCEQHLLNLEDEYVCNRCFVVDKFLCSIVNLAGSDMIILKSVSVHDKVGLFVGQQSFEDALFLSLDQPCGVK